MTAERVRAAVAAVTDPELRRPIGELDMVREINSAVSPASDPTKALAKACAAMTQV